MSISNLSPREHSLPVSLSSLQRPTQCHGLCVHPPDRANKHNFGPDDKISPEASHVGCRSFPVAGLWHQSPCVFDQEKVYCELCSEFHSMTPDIPDRTSPL